MTRTTAFRIIQETLTNTRKHAGAAVVEVVLEQSDQGLLVRVTDDGVGFDVDAVARRPAPGHGEGWSPSRWRAIGSRPPNLGACGCTC